MGPYVDRCVDFGAKHNGRAMERQWYDDCENVLYSWAVSHSTNATSTGSAVESSYVGLAEALQAATGQQITAAAGTVPSPIVWRTAANAYVQMAVEWPQHRRAVGTLERVQNIVNIGAVAETAINGLSLSSASQSVTSRGDLYGRVVTYYRNGLAGVRAAVNALEAQYQSRLGYNLWGAANQVTAADPHKHAELRPCDGRDGGSITLSLQSPSGIQGLPELRAARILEQLGVYPLTICYSGVWIADTYGGDRDQFKIDIVAQIAGSRIMMRRWITPRVREFDAERAFAANWPAWKEQVLPQTVDFLAQVFGGQQPPGQASTDALVRARFMVEAAAFYNEVIGSLRSGGGEIGRAGRELDKAKGLLAALIGWAAPETLKRNDAIRAMLFGNDGLVDTSRLVFAIRGRTLDARLEFDATGDAETGVFRRLLDEWLSERLATAGAPANWELRESLDQLRSLQQLVASDRP